jgi:hypothetical protein
MLAYYYADHALSLRYPAGWRTEQAEQDGVFYRYFLGPPDGPDRKPSVSTTLLAGPLGGSLDDYAQSYLAGNTVSSTRDEQRQGARGKAWRFTSADATLRHSLLLLQEEQRVYGLYSQGQRGPFQDQLPLIDEMERSLTLERPGFYPEHASARFAFSLRVPPSWTQSRSFSGGDRYLVQFASPALALEKDQALNASLTLNVEPAGGDLALFHKRARDTMGETQKVVSHAAWHGGLVDLAVQETPVAVSRNKRYYFVAAGRGYTLTCEAREDVFFRVSRWCDLVASTLRVGPAGTAAPPAAAPG